MIQDDPINNLKSKAQGYLPLNLDSDEDIAVKEIVVSKGGNEMKLTSKSEGNKVYYKYLMLIGLYIMQGIPLGLVFGSIPYMLKSEKSNTLSYSQFGLFSLAGYPYSLKLIWSPLVDQIYSRKLGRRKSWILPVQSLVGVLFYVLGRRIDQWIVPGKPVNFWRLNGCFLALVTLCATLDVAVDGWALTLLPSDKIHFASTCQSVGVNVGLFISFTIFLAFSSARFCKEFLGISKELFTLGSFMRFWAVIYLLFTGLLLLKGEKEQVKQQGNKNNNPQVKNNNTQVNSDNPQIKNNNTQVNSDNTQVNSDNPQVNSDNPQVKQGNNNDNPTTNSANTRPSTISSIVKGYKTLWGIITLPTVRSFALILLSFKFGFSAYDAVAPLKLLEKGFPKEFLALTVLIDFPFQMIMGFFVAKWSAGPRTFRPWIIATYFRIIMSFVGLYVISKFPLDGLTNSYAASIIFTTILTSFCHTTMFVSLAAYFVKISDPKYGGTYLTLLNTLSNFAGMWPKLPVMSAVDWLSKKNCINNLNGASDCKLEFDGFYLVASFCLILGFLIFQFWIKPEIKKLEIIPKHHWTIHSTSLIDVNEKINT